MRNTKNLVKGLIDVMRKQSIQCFSSELMPQGLELTNDDIINIYNVEVMRFIYLLMTSSKELTDNDKTDFNYYFDLNFTTVSELEECAEKLNLSDSYTERFPMIFRLAVMFDSVVDEISKKANNEERINFAEGLLSAFTTIAEEIVAMNCNDDYIATMKKDMELVYLKRCIREPHLMPDLENKEGEFHEMSDVSESEEDNGSDENINFAELKEIAKEKIDNVYRFLEQIQPSNIEISLTETYKLELRDFLFYAAYLDGSLNLKELELINYFLDTSYTMGDVLLLKKQDELPRTIFYEQAPRALIILTAAVNSKTEAKDGVAARGFIGNYRHIGLTILYASENFSDELIEKLDAYLETLEDYVTRTIEDEEDEDNFEEKADYAIPNDEELNTNYEEIDIDVIKDIYKYHFIFENKFNDFIEECKIRLKNINIPRNKISVSTVFSFYNQTTRDPSDLSNLIFAQTRMIHYAAKEYVKGTKIDIPFDDVLTDINFPDFGMDIESELADIFTESSQENNNQYDLAGYIIQNRFSHGASLEEIKTRSGVTLKPKAYNCIYRSGSELSRLRDAEKIFLQYQDKIIDGVNNLWHEQFDLFINQLYKWKDKYIHTNVGTIADENNVNREDYFKFIASNNGVEIKKEVEEEIQNKNVDILKKIKQKSEKFLCKSSDLSNEISQIQGFILGRNGLKKRKLMTKKKIFDKCCVYIKNELILGGYTKLNVNESDLIFRHSNLCDVYLRYNLSNNKYDVYSAEENRMICSLNEDFTEQYGSCRLLYGCIIENQFMYDTNDVPNFYLTVLLDQTNETFLNELD